MPRHDLHQALFWLIPGFLFVIIPALSSSLGGWRALARRYHRRAPLVGGQFILFASMWMRRTFLPVDYRNSVFIRVTPVGIGLAVPPWSRLFHPPLTIPWDAIADYRQEPFWWSSLITVYVNDPPVRLEFIGRASARVWRGYLQDGRQKSIPLPLHNPLAKVTAHVHKKFLDLSGQ